MKIDHTIAPPVNASIQRSSTFPSGRSSTWSRHQRHPVQIDPDCPNLSVTDTGNILERMDFYEILRSLCEPGFLSSRCRSHSPVPYGKTLEFRSNFKSMKSTVHKRSGTVFFLQNLTSAQSRWTPSLYLHHPATYPTHSRKIQGVLSRNSCLLCTNREKKTETEVDVCDILWQCLSDVVSRLAQVPDLCWCPLYIDPIEAGIIEALDRVPPACKSSNRTCWNSETGKSNMTWIWYSPQKQHKWACSEIPHLSPGQFKCLLLWFLLCLSLSCFLTTLSSWRCPKTPLHDNPKHVYTCSWHKLGQHARASSCAPSASASIPIKLILSALRAESITTEPWRPWSP